MSDLELQDFPIITEDKIRYADTDRQGHVNNAVFNQFLETGRVEIIYKPTNPLHNPDASFVIAKLNINFLSELKWPGIVQIGTKVKSIGKSSFVLEQILVQENSISARAETVIVQVNQNSKRSEELNLVAKSILQNLI